MLAFDFEMAQFTGNPVMHCHHIESRGMGGGTRDDSLENLLAYCPDCHFEEHGI